MSNALRLALLVDPLMVRLGGAEHAGELAAALAARGHEVCAFGAELQGAGAAQVRSGPAAALSVLGFRPDAVLAYDALSPAAWLGSRIARRRKIPLVLIEAGAFRGGTALARLLRRGGEAFWGPYVRRSAGALVALDPVAREQALREGFREGRIRVLPHGVDLERYRAGLASPLLARHRIRGRLLLCAGPLDERSGAEDLIAAFARTVGQRGDWSLVLAGNGHAPPWLRACADRLGVGALVHFLRPAPDELPALVSSSTLYAAPSLDGGGGGAQLARAMACGRAVIASDVPRHGWLVEHERNGLLAPPGDVAGWTAALARATGAPEARARWGARARALAEARLGWSTIAREFESALRVAPLARPARLGAPKRA
jgi:glycosyltransferase involved in cell wall biosynthesis